MKLLPIKGFPNYRIDCENHVLYTLNRSVLQPMKKGAYDCIVLSDRKAYSLQKLEWCALHDISPKDIPSGYCFSRSADGNVEVVTRSEIHQRANKNMRKGTLDMETAEKMLKAMRSGDKDEYMKIAYTEGIRAEQDFLSKHCRSQAVVDSAVELALKSIEYKYDNGNVVLNVFSFVRHYIYVHLADMKKRRRTYIDDMKPIIINEMED